MTGRPRGRRPRRPVPPSKGAGRPCIRRTGSSRPTDGCDDCPGISAAQHRRRPGGPSRYSAATFRACRVTPTRATRGAAAPVTKHKKEPGVDARPVLVLSVQLSAAMNPRTGGSRVGEAPRPFFPPISSGRNGGARRAGAPPGAPRQVDGAPRSSRPTGWWIRRQAGAHTGAPLRIDSEQFLDLTRRATTGHPRGRRAESSRPTGPAVAGENGRMISAPTGRW